ncbi:hypothetical protein [uncultured Arthrobacter sp.]|uniref:hypothetical protein n=1 Tax=uncultured Arthrobacter sp. TaxID=114050 RepID=UPI0026092FC5|nr:hypothetical protein [uncultured Arthrobacter sp.]
MDVAEIDNFHPVFELAEHFRGRDNYEAPGYTGNPYSGDHISIPAWQVKEEVEDFYVLETSYHRGKVISELVNYPDAHHAVRAAIIAVIKSVQPGNR